MEGVDKEQPFDDRSYAVDRTDGPMISVLTDVYKMMDRQDGGRP